MLFADEVRRAINASPNRLLDISLSTIGEHILPIGPFGSYLLFRLARKSYLNSRQKEVDYLKLIRGEIR